MSVPQTVDALSGRDSTPGTFNSVPRFDRSVRLGVLVVVPESATLPLV